MKRRIVAFHLLNDRSGSPKVLSQLVRKWASEDREVHLFTGVGTGGFLSDIGGVHYHHAWYKFRSNPWLRLVYYTLSQVLLMARLLVFLKKEDIVYVNTVLPYGAALTGRIKGCRVIYHVHESTVNPAILKWFLLQVVRSTASEIICVSAYVQQSLGLSPSRCRVVYNALDETFLNNVKPRPGTHAPKNVLMVCSLKKYKGVMEFVQLAADHPLFKCELVLNASVQEITDFFHGHTLPVNLETFPAQKDLHPFFCRADVILNLSRPDGWVETFGLTIIEGMAYGLPAIVPPVGGILEVIEEGVTGYSVDCTDRQKLNLVLSQVMEDGVAYNTMSRAATERLGLFREDRMFREINEVLD